MYSLSVFLKPPRYFHNIKYIYNPSLIDITFITVEDIYINILYILIKSWRNCVLFFIQHDLKLLNVTPEWCLCATDITGALTPYVSEISKVKGSHLCPLTPGCFSGVWWTCVLSAEECGAGRCCRESPLPGWARPRTHPPQCSAGAHLWTSPWAWIEITTIQNMSMEQNLKCTFLLSK